MRLDSVMEEIEGLCKKIPKSGQMFAIKGIGIIIVAEFLAKVGDVRRFRITKVNTETVRTLVKGKQFGKA